MKMILTMALLLLALGGRSQSLDFANTEYFTARGNALTATGQTLINFNYSGADTLHPLFQNGLYFPIVDFQNRNLWVRLRHIAHDPNGTTVGHNVAATSGGPFRAGLGGWWGFLYQFEIYADATPTGTRTNTLNGLYPTNITVESLETLSNPELVSFELLNPEASNWALNSINFTGSNPGSRPGFSAVNLPHPGNPVGSGFSTTFPAASRNMYVIDYGGGGSYAEFRMSADRVSSFRYGYEYPDGGGYQGMNLTFGIPSATGVSRNLAASIGFKVYPTVADGEATVAYTLPRPGPATLSLTDALGREQVIWADAAPANPVRTRISMAGQASGLYYLMLKTESGRATARIIKP